MAVSKDLGDTELSHRDFPIELPVWMPGCPIRYIWPVPKCNGPVEFVPAECCRGPRNERQAVAERTYRPCGNSDDLTFPVIRQLRN